ncbi:MAG: YncE family protein [Candidatus Limisoma sp.]
MLALLACIPLFATSQEVVNKNDSMSGGSTVKESIDSQKSNKDKVPPVVHSSKNDTSTGVKGSMSICNIGKRQQFSAAQSESFDTDIYSPKSAIFSSDGSLFINSLEGCRTVAYSVPSLEKKFVVEYKFASGQGELWASPSGFYTFTHYPNGERRSFSGKPVEMAWSHNHKYLWVPFYRRTFDINAQDPSAIAVVDVAAQKIIRMFETGPLPKAVAVSHDNHYVAVTHWGNNTVGLIDIASNNPGDWHHLSPVEVGKKLVLNYPLNVSVNRDKGSGYLLRGTIFTPDNRYLLVSGLAGPLSVIDVEKRRHVGFVHELYGIRHLTFSNGRVLGSRNVAGEVLSFALDDLLRGVDKFLSKETQKLTVDGAVRRVKVGGGARTLEVSPDGKYIFVACNSASALYAVDAETMKVVDKIRCDSYPVGLAISPDGRYIAVTSQGRKGFGGNAVNLFEVTRYDIKPIEPAEVTNEVASDSVQAQTSPISADSRSVTQASMTFYTLLALALFAVVVLVVVCVWLVRRHRK